MAEIAKQARRRGKAASDQAASQIDDDAGDAVAPDSGERDDANGSGSSNGRTITSELKETFREAAIEVLKPVMRQATSSEAKYAVKQGPGLVKNKVAPKIQDAGGAGALMKGVASKGGGVAGTVGGIASSIGDKLPGGGKKEEGESPSGTGRGRRLPVEEFVDVGADLETVYDQFTQFEDWPQFMHRVERIEQRDEATLMWHENIWGIRRSWEAEITDQSPCHRIAWRSTSGPQSIGVVTFHRLSDHLTRVALTMDFQPKGLFEKTSSGTRISRRALRSDLMRFKAFIELRDEATGSWRGRIEDGEVVDDRDDQEPRDEERDEDGPEAAEDEETDVYDEDDEESVAYEDEDEEDEEPVASEDDEDDEEPVASEDEEDEEEPVASEDEEDDEEPVASEDDEEYEVEDEEEEEDDAEPVASEDEDEPEEKPRPRRRRAKAKPKAKATASTARRRR